jgi:hypothetical protein
LIESNQLDQATTFISVAIESFVNAAPELLDGLENNLSEEIEGCNSLRISSMIHLANLLGYQLAHFGGLLI